MESDLPRSQRPDSKASQALSSPPSLFQFLDIPKGRSHSPLSEPGVSFRDRRSSLRRRRRRRHQRGSSAEFSDLLPPFYNRPPATLPPSPSLSSIFRRSFDGSGTAQETGSKQEDRSDGGEKERVGKSSASRMGSSALDTPSPSPDSAGSARTSRSSQPFSEPLSPPPPSYEYFGFAVYVLSTAAFGIYLLWAAIPSPFLHRVGIYYYPNRWWALAIPAWITVTLLYVYVALASYNTGYLTLPIESVENLVDEAGCLATPGRLGGGKAKRGDERSTGDGAGAALLDNRAGEDDRPAPLCRSFGPRPRHEWLAEWSSGTDAVLDVPIGGVCEILYS